MSWAGCYCFEPHCDDCHRSVQFTDEYGTRARAMARAAGWLFSMDASTLVLCPRCRVNHKTETKPNR